MRMPLHILLVTAILGMATTVLATGQITFTEWGKSTPGVQLECKATGRCPTNGANDPVIVSIEIKNQAGTVVASGNAAGTGTGPVGCQVNIPAGSVHDGDRFTAHIEVEQTVGDGTEQDTVHTV